MPTTIRQAGRREWIALAVLALPCVLYSMDLTVLNLAVPHLAADLAPSSSELLWIVDIYGFVIAGSLITMGTLGDRIGRRRVLLIGAAAFASAGLMALARVEGLAGVVVGSVLFSIGTAAVPTLATEIIVGSAPADRAGAASALSETSTELGGALGIALLGSLGTAIYRSHLGDGVPAEADTLAGAVALAAKLPRERGDALLETARAAFGHAFATTAAVGAAILLATAAVAVTLLRGPARAEPPAEAAEPVALCS